MPKSARGQIPGGRCRLRQFLGVPDARLVLREPHNGDEQAQGYSATEAGAPPPVWWHGERRGCRAGNKRYCRPRVVLVPGLYQGPLLLVQLFIAFLPLIFLQQPNGVEVVSGYNTDLVHNHYSRGTTRGSNGESRAEAATASASAARIGALEDRHRAGDVEMRALHRARIRRPDSEGRPGGAETGLLQLSGVDHGGLHLPSRATTSPPKHSTTPIYLTSEHQAKITPTRTRNSSSRTLTPSSVVTTAYHHLEQRPEVNMDTTTPTSNPSSFFLSSEILNSRAKKQKAVFFLIFILAGAFAGFVVMYCWLYMAGKMKTNGSKMNRFSTATSGGGQQQPRRARQNQQSPEGKNAVGDDDERVDDVDSSEDEQEKLMKRRIKTLLLKTPSPEKKQAGNNSKKQYYAISPSLYLKMKATSYHRDLMALQHPTLFASPSGSSMTRSSTRPRSPKDFSRTGRTPTGETATSGRSTTDAASSATHLNISNLVLKKSPVKGQLVVPGGLVQVLPGRNANFSTSSTRASCTSSKPPRGTGPSTASAAGPLLHRNPTLFRGGNHAPLSGAYGRGNSVKNLHQRLSPVLSSNSSTSRKASSHGHATKLHNSASILTGPAAHHSHHYHYHLLQRSAKSEPLPPIAEDSCETDSTSCEDVKKRRALVRPLAEVAGPCCKDELEQHAADHTTKVAVAAAGKIHVAGTTKSTSKHPEPIRRKSNETETTLDDTFEDESPGISV
ncbi:unnamed protein product [Amoebophrya sp. A120]|nr:unnamed protein product [Amoebophrya sp. A120]|eukprot:GSA120T00016861001.1